jgi:hypothetical protein
VDLLADLVLRRLAELGEPGSPLSLRRAAERSQGLISYELLRRISRGEHGGGISDRVAQGLSIALDVPIKDIYMSARVPRPESRWILPARFDRLDAAERRVVESVAAAILEAREKGLRGG